MQSDPFTPKSFESQKQCLADPDTSSFTILFQLHWEPLGDGSGKLVISRSVHSTWARHTVARCGSSPRENSASGALEIHQLVIKNGNDRIFCAGGRAPWNSINPQKRGWLNWFTTVCHPQTWQVRAWARASINGSLSLPCRFCLVPRKPGFANWKCYPHLGMGQVHAGIGMHVVR